MASLLRQIVAGPRSRHPEAGLDLCYVTDNIIATSGPSGTYPQRAYRNPLDELVKWLDSKHGDDWAIWEFRAEGTGYPDSDVYNRIYHYPFPDHHPPPFALIPNIMASMRNWLKAKEGRVVVVHCKAGKGRSGTAGCSYLIAEEGWPAEEALKRFTERRMRPNMGKGVSIPSQLRWIGYVERWAKHGKIYVHRQVEVLEVHCWGLRDGVKIQVEGFIDGGKRIKTFHTFTGAEREIVRGRIGKSGGLASVVGEVMAQHSLGRTQNKDDSKASSPASPHQVQSTTSLPTDSSGIGTTADAADTSKEGLENDGTGDVVFRPSRRIVLESNDVNIDIERRNKAAFDLTYVTAVAHVWFNAYFEGRGPEQGGNADESGVFEISWDAMDGIKGSSRKGVPAFDKIAVVWRTLHPEGKPGVVVPEPGEGEYVPQSSPADWKGESHVEPSEGRDLGLRTASPPSSSGNVSKASSLKGNANDEDSKEPRPIVTAPDPVEDSTAGVRSYGPDGAETIGDPDNNNNVSSDTSKERQPLPSSSSVVRGITHTSTGDVHNGQPE